GTFARNLWKKQKPSDIDNLISRHEPGKNYRISDLELSSTSTRSRQPTESSDDCDLSLTSLFPLKGEGNVSITRVKKGQLSDTNDGIENSPLHITNNREVKQKPRVSIIKVNRIQSSVPNEERTDATVRKEDVEQDIPEILLPERRVSVVRLPRQKSSCYVEPLKSAISSNIVQARRRKSQVSLSKVKRISTAISEVSVMKVPRDSTTVKQESSHPSDESKASQRKRTNTITSEVSVVKVPRDSTAVKQESSRPSDESKASQRKRTDTTTSEVSVVKVPRDSTAVKQESSHPSDESIARQRKSIVINAPTIEQIYKQLQPPPSARSNVAVTKLSRVLKQVKDDRIDDAAVEDID
ncbi:unnamed protein product, partial [Didymodactylos carnosus]